MKITHIKFFLAFALVIGLPVLATAYQPGDVQAQLNSQAAEIAELRDLINGKVDNGTSKSDVKLSGRVHADYWGIPGSDQVIADLEGNPDGPQDRIGFRRMRFGVKGDIAPNMNWEIMDKCQDLLNHYICFYQDVKFLRIFVFHSFLIFPYLKSIL